MTESISSWLVRTAGAVFVVAFLGSLWQESLKFTPTRDDLNDVRFEMLATASSQRGRLPSSKLLATNDVHASSSFHKGLARAMHFAQRSRTATKNSLPH
jgi:hypothetical protein